jgi:hypothetical protein
MTLSNNTNQQSENRRYLRYTQLLNGSAAIAATLLGAWILISPERRNDPAWVYWLMWTMATLHTQEEYLFPGGFVTWFNTVAFGSKDPNFPLSAKRAFQTDGVAAIFVMFIFIILGKRFLPVVFIFVAVAFVNGFFHIIETIKQGRYSPGFVTSLLLYLPGIPALTYFYFSRGLLSPLEIGLAFALGLALHAGFFGQVRGWLRAQAA